LRRHLLGLRDESVVGKYSVNGPYLEGLTGVKGPGCENKLCRFAIPDESGEEIGATKLWGHSYSDKGSAKFCPFGGQTNITGERYSKTKAIGGPIDGCDHGFRVLDKCPGQIE